MATSVDNGRNRMNIWYLSFKNYFYQRFTNLFESADLQKKYLFWAFERSKYHVRNRSLFCNSLNNLSCTFYHWSHRAGAFFIMAHENFKRIFYWWRWEKIIRVHTDFYDRFYIFMLELIINEGRTLYEENFSYNRNISIANVRTNK